MTEVAVVLRNDRSQSLYVEPFAECNDPSSSIVDWQRNGATVQVRGDGACGRQSCEDVQDHGFHWDVTCPDSCQPKPSLIRLEPGAELDAGRLWTEAVRYGISPGMEPMPDACVPGSWNPRTDPAVQCFAQVPLAHGPYRIVARAFEALQCPLEHPCDCKPDASGSCDAHVQYGIGTAIEAEATPTLPVTGVTLSFR